MLKIIFTEHAIERSNERGISKKEIKKFIETSNKIECSTKNSKRFLIKKIYFNKKFKKDCLLLIVVEIEKVGFKSNYSN